MPLVLRNNRPISQTHQHNQPTVAFIWRPLSLAINSHSSVPLFFGQMQDQSCFTGLMCFTYDEHVCCPAPLQLSVDKYCWYISHQLKVRRNTIHKATTDYDEDFFSFQATTQTTDFYSTIIAVVCVVDTLCRNKLQTLVIFHFYTIIEPIHVCHWIQRDFPTQ